MMENDEIQSGIVAILSRKTLGDTYLGTGFLTGDGIIVTCSHVLQKAREKGGIVRIQFQGHEPIETKIITFSPTSQFDIAILRPLSNLPAGVRRLPLTFASAGVDHDFKTFGHPNISIDIQRLAGEGRILAILRDSRNHLFLQLSSKEITQGYSGCPVWDKKLNAVVGMVSSGISDTGTSFAIPCENLKEIYPVLELVRRSADQRPGGPLFSIPDPPRNFIGRTAEIADLLSYFGKGGTIIGLSGGGGVGKSALALVLAKKLEDQFPDARIKIDLQGAPQSGLMPLTAEDALRILLQSFYPLTQLPNTEQALRALMVDTIREKRILILLDNAKDADQVRSLLPPAPSAVIITSRAQIIFPDLEMELKELDKLPLRDARKLLRKAAPILLQARRATLDALAIQCGALPLALNVAAALLISRKNAWTPERLVKELADERSRLPLLKLKGDSYMNVEASLSLSYNQLNMEQRWCFRILGIFAAPFDELAIKFLWGLSPEKSDDVIGDFLQLSLLEYHHNDPMPYRLHDLTRIYAENQLDNAPEKWEWNAATRRHAEYFLQQGWVGNEIYKKGHDHVIESLQNFETIWPHLKAAYLRHRYLYTKVSIKVSMEAGDNSDVVKKQIYRWLSDLPGKIAYTSELRLHPWERIEILQYALRAAKELQDLSEAAVHHGNLGWAYWSVGEYNKAVVEYEDALELMQEVGNRMDQGSVKGNLGLAYIAQKKPEIAIKHFKEQLEIAIENNDRLGTGIALGNLGFAYLNIDHYEHAIGFYEKRLVIVREKGDLRGESQVLRTLGHAHYQLGNLDAAMLYYKESLRIASEIGDKFSEAETCWHIGLLFEAKDQFHDAVKSMQVAVDYYKTIQHSVTAEYEKKMEEVRMKLVT